MIPRGGYNRSDSKSLMADAAPVTKEDSDQFGDVDLCTGEVDDDGKPYDKGI